MLARIRASLARSDVRRQPVRAICRRVWWRLRWTVRPRAPWRLPLDGMTLEVPSRLGAGALVYYQGTSEPATAQALGRLLRAGDTFFDVGAHVGEYTLIGARQVGASGAVHAFEPNPALAAAVRRNVALNGLSNCRVIEAATSDCAGEMILALAGDPSEAHLSPETRAGTDRRAGYPVRVLTLDEYWASAGRPRVRLMKMDIEGAELLALRGAGRLLRTGGAPTLLCEALSHTTRRFGYGFAELHGYLTGLGYELFDLEAVTSGVAPRPLESFPPSGNVIATRTVPELLAALAPAR